jgi:hypothetical protein
MQPLGGLISTHPVANSRRWVAGLGSLLIVAAAAGLLVFLIADPWGSRNFGAALASGCSSTVSPGMPGWSPTR